MQLPFFKTCTKCNQTKFFTEFSKDRAKKDGHHTVCKQCQRERWRNLYENDPEFREKFKDHVKDYYKRNPDKVKERVRKWKSENAESSKERRKQYWHEQVDKDAYNAKRRERRKELYQTDPEFRERRKQESRHSAKIRKYRMRGVEGSYTQDEWNALCAKYGHRCLCCHEQKPLTVDHVVPISKGGTNYISNIQPLCQPCNKRKNTKTIDYRK